MGLRVKDEQHIHMHLYEDEVAKEYGPLPMSLFATTKNVPCTCSSSPPPSFHVSFIMCVIRLQKKVNINFRIFDVFNGRCKSILQSFHVLIIFQYSIPFLSMKNLMQHAFFCCRCSLDCIDFETAKKFGNLKNSCTYYYMQYACTDKKTFIELLIICGDEFSLKEKISELISQTK